MITYYTSDAVDYLEANIAKNLDWYYGSHSEPADFLANCKTRTSEIIANQFGNFLETDEIDPHKTDAKNALIVYNALSELTPHQASISRLWIYLCHTEAKEYVTGRWYIARRKTIDEDVKNVRNHFFVSNDRSLIRDNAISRLWWLGKIAVDVDHSEPEKFLEITLHKQDVRSALIERPSTSRNRNVLKAIYAVMCKYWENDGELFIRDNFRKWMVNLNRRGGVILFDALNKTELDKILNEEAEKAIQD